MSEQFDREDELVWKWSSNVAAMRGDSHGGGYAPEPAYLEDFELDRDETPEDAQREFDDLSNSEQNEIEQRAHRRELDKI
jgi:hypothetical protein